MRVLIEFEKKPLYFENPYRVIACHTPGAIKQAFEDIEKALSRGFYVAGFLSYEAGFAFEPSLRPPEQSDFPLLCMGVYGSPACEKPPLISSQFRLSGLESNISQESYFADIERIKARISTGDVYQITYCRKKKFRVEGDAYALYRSLYRAQPVPYPAFIETDRFKLLSLSPEMFVRKTGKAVAVKPMKGSWPARTLKDRMFGGFRLHYDRKNRAENVMIADLLRNDLGRIGQRVVTPKLFEVERYRTIFQMTSTVTAEVSAGLSTYDLFHGIFPSGSVTGAPKIKAMEVIRSLEKEERKIFTGAIGYITPRRDLFFNVPIRTLLVEGNKGEMGIGGGIVWDSTPRGEWEEGEWKSAFLNVSECRRPVAP